MEKVVPFRTGYGSGLCAAWYDGSFLFVLFTLSSGADGHVSGPIDYDVFGEPVTETGVFVGASGGSGGISALVFAYAGKPYDPVTGLSDYGFRDYAPTLARFTTVDPVRDGSNWYAYCNGDPVNFVDAWGLCTSDKGSGFSHLSGEMPIKDYSQQFVWASVQIFGGVIETISGFVTEGVSAGVSTYAVIDGLYNIADGLIGIVAAASNTEYGGAIPSVAGLVAQKAGATKEQQEAIEATAGLVDSIIDTIVTKGLSLVNKSKTASSIVKATQVIDKLNDMSSKLNLGKQTTETIKETIDVLKETGNKN